MPDLTDKRVAVLSTDGFEDSELTEPVLALTEAGALVDIVSTRSGTITGKNGHESRVDLTTADAEASNYDALVLPGGVANGDTIRMDANAVSFTREFFEQHKPVAAISQSKQGPNLQQRKRWQGFGPCALVGLFSSHANELRRAHHHIRCDAAAENRMLSARRERKPQPRISEARADQIVEAYMAGGTVYDLAREFDCHRVTISAVLKRRGATLRRLPPSDEQVSEMIRLYESGLSLSKVGERLGFNATTVLHRLRAVGHTSRSSYQP